MKSQEFNKLAVQAIAPTQATLGKLDGSSVVTFVLNPESLEWSANGTYSKLPVLGTAQPLVRFKNSEANLSFPVKFWTPGNNRDLSGILNQLAQWTLPDTKTLEPEILKFSWGDTQIPRCYLESFSWTVTQWRSGKPTSATGTVKLLIAPELPAVQRSVTEQNVTLTSREVMEQTELVKAKLKDPALSKKFGVLKGDTLRVNKDGTVDRLPNGGTVTRLGTLKDILGEVKPGLRNVGDSGM